MNNPWTTRSNAKSVRLGAMASSAVGTDRANRLRLIARLRSMFALNAPTTSPATAMPSVLALAATPISDAETP